LLSFLGLPLVLISGLLARGEKLAVSIKQPPLPRAHLGWMDGRMDEMVGGDLLDRLHGDPGLELGIVAAALAQLLRRRLRLRWEPLSGAAPRLGS